VLGLMIAIAGCSTPAASVIKTATSAASVSEESLPMVDQLVVGTFRLEGTEQAVDAKQAADLLPLWKAYRNMSSSTSSSLVEVQALLQQISGEMTEEQLNAIAAMELTAQDMMQLIKERGIDVTRNAGGAISATARESQRPAIGGAGMPGAPGGGGVPPAGDWGTGGFAGGMPAEGTPSAQRPGEGSASIPVPGPLYNALIELLKSKV